MMTEHRSIKNKDYKLHTVRTRATQCTIAVCEWRGEFHIFCNILFRATSMILMEENDKDHNVHPYKESIVTFNGSVEPNVHKTVFTFRFL